MTTERKCGWALFGGIAFCLLVGLVNVARARADDTAFARTLSSRPPAPLAIDLRP
jgi:hypothetical protein